MLRKIPAALLAAVLILVFGACGERDNDSAPEPEESSAESERVPLEPIIDWDEGDEEAEPEPDYPLLELSLEEAMERLTPDDSGVVPISTSEDLAALAVLVASGDTTHRDKTFVMQNDISLAQTAFVPIGGGDSFETMPMFGGSFDGGNYVISGLTITSKSANIEGNGLFGAIAAGGSVSNLHLIQGELYAGTVTGGLAGYNAGSLVNCSFGGSITAKGQYIGGFCGLLANDASINGCFSNAQLTGTTYVGGFIGCTMPGSQVRSCYALGSVTSVKSPSIDNPTQIGGFIGRQENGAVEECYAYTEVYTRVSSQIVGGFMGYNEGDPQNCYYNQTATENWKAIDANYNDSDDGVTGCTVEEMLEQSTYTGWDFESTWDMRDDRSRGLPHLRAAWDD